MTSFARQLGSRGEGVQKIVCRCFARRLKEVNRTATVQNSRERGYLDACHDDRTRARGETKTTRNQHTARTTKRAPVTGINAPNSQPNGEGVAQANFSLGCA